MTKKNIETKNSNEYIPKIDMTAFGNPDKPPLDALVGLYIKGLYTIGLVEDLTNDLRKYVVRDFKTHKKITLSNFPSIICGDGCSLDSQINLIEKQIRELEDQRDLAQVALPVLYTELEDKKSERDSSKKDK